MQATALGQQRAGGESPVRSMLPEDNGDGAAQQPARSQRQDSPELLCTTRSQSGPAGWESMMDWNDDSRDGSPKDTAIECGQGDRSGGSGSEQPASKHQTLLRPPSPPLKQQPPEQRQQRQQQQQQQGSASTDYNVQPPARQQQPSQQQPAQQPARSVRGIAPAAATKQQQQQPAGGAAPPAPAASAFLRPSVSTGADAWRPSRVPSIRSGSALAGAWPAVPPVQSGNAYSAAMSWGVRQPSGATDSGVAPVVAAALRSVSAAVAEGSSTAPRGKDGSLATTSLRAAAAAVGTRSLSVPGAAEGGGGDGSGSGGGKRRKKVHNPLQRASFPPMQTQPSDPDKLMSVAEIDSLVAKYTAAAAPALGFGVDAPGLPGQVGGLRLCSAPGGLQVGLSRACDTILPSQMTRHSTLGTVNRQNAAVSPSTSSRLGLVGESGRSCCRSTSARARARWTRHRAAAAMARQAPWRRRPLAASASWTRPCQASRWDSVPACTRTHSNHPSVLLLSGLVLQGLASCGPLGSQLSH
jgi:hypothetical protein